MRPFCSCHPDGCPSVRNGHPMTHMRFSAPAIPRRDSYGGRFRRHRNYYCRSSGPGAIKVQGGLTALVCPALLLIGLASGTGAARAPRVPAVRRVRRQVSPNRDTAGEVPTHEVSYLRFCTSSCGEPAPLSPHTASTVWEFLPEVGGGVATTGKVAYSPKGAIGAGCNVCAGYLGHRRRCRVGSRRSRRVVHHPRDTATLRPVPGPSLRAPYTDGHVAICPLSKGGGLKLTLPRKECAITVGCGLT